MTARHVVHTGGTVRGLLGIAALALVKDHVDHSAYRIHDVLPVPLSG